jgi:hypothetical protein
MDFLRILDLQELVRVDVSERDIGGECKIDRHFRKPKDSTAYISTTTNENRFTGKYPIEISHRKDLIITNRMRSCNISRLNARLKLNK